jgi:hypothetical protein
MLTANIFIGVLDGSIEGYALSMPFDNVPKGSVVQVLNIRCNRLPGSTIPLECGIYEDGRGDNPSVGLASDTNMLKRWGVIDLEFSSVMGMVLTPLNPLLVLPGAMLTAYLYKVSSGDCSIVLTVGYEYVKVSDETQIGLRRVGGVVELP